MANTILIVDDSASVRQLVGYTLRGAGYQVIDAADGVEAVNKLNGDKVDVIVTDLNMPKMDGMEFLKQVRNSPSNKFTPVVMLTTESQKAKVLEAKSSGVSGWIVKPFTPEKLIEVIKKFLK